MQKFEIQWKAENSTPLKTAERSENIFRGNKSTWTELLRRSEMRIFKKLIAFLIKIRAEEGGRGRGRGRAEKRKKYFRQWSWKRIARILSFKKSQFPKLLRSVISVVRLFYLPSLSHLLPPIFLFSLFLSYHLTFHFC